MVERLLVVASDAGVRQSLAVALTLGGFRVDACASAREAERRIADTPAMVLVDLALADADAVDFVRRSLSRVPALLVVALAARGDDERILAVIRAGARGCLFLDDVGERLVAAVREALTGGRPMSRGMGGLLLEHVRRTPRHSSQQRGAVRPLTERERVVLEHLARGLGYEEIARVLGVSLNTVRSFIRAIYAKLDVTSRTQAVIAGTRIGLVKRTPYPDAKAR